MRKILLFMSFTCGNITWRDTVYEPYLSHKKDLLKNKSTSNWTVQKQRATESSKGQNTDTELKGFWEKYVYILMVESPLSIGDVSPHRHVRCPTFGLLGPGPPSWVPAGYFKKYENRIDFLQQMHAFLKTKRLLDSCSDLM